MKKRIIGLLLGVMLVFGCVGCGAESKTTEPTETATATTIEESTTEQIEEATATPEKTAEPTPDVKEEPSEETTAETESEATEPAEKVEPEPMEEPTPEPQAIYTYTDMSATMYVQQTVNVRDLPDTRGNKLGSLSTNDEIKISGQCIETGWYRFDYNGNVAYVSNKYVGDEKVEVAPPASNNSGSGSANSGSVASNWADSYPKNQWIDMGEYFFYICNSESEARLNCCYDFTHSTREMLSSRYPDRGSYEISFFTEKGNIPVIVVSTEYEDASGYHRPKFVWE